MLYIDGKLTPTVTIIVFARRIQHNDEVLKALMTPNLLRKHINVYARTSKNTHDCVNIRKGSDSDVRFFCWCMVGWPIERNHLLKEV